MINGPSEILYHVTLVTQIIRKKKKGNITNACAKHIKDQVKTEADN